MKSLSEFVKEQRKEANMIQKEFAEQTGVTLTVIREIEERKSDLSLEKVIQILKMFEHILPLNYEEPVFKKKLLDKGKKKECLVE